MVHELHWYLLFWKMHSPGSYQHLTRDELSKIMADSILNILLVLGMCRKVDNWPVAGPWHLPFQIFEDMCCEKILWDLQMLQSLPLQDISFSFSDWSIFSCLSEAHKYGQSIFNCLIDSLRNEYLPFSHHGDSESHFWYLLGTLGYFYTFAFFLLPVKEHHSVFLLTWRRWFWGHT